MLVSNIETDSLPLLKDILIDEFQKFFYTYKKDDIYAYLLTLDQFHYVKHLSISTERSIFGDTEDKKQYLTYEDKWNFNLWKYRHTISKENFILQNNIPTFKTSILENVYSDSGISSEQHNPVMRYLEAMQQAKEYILQIYRLNPENIIFLITMENDRNILIDSAHYLNTPSSLLYECIATIKSQIPSSNKSNVKLSQADKDLLIDFAQMIHNLENDDPLQISQQAYLLTLDPLFSTTNPYIQNLIQYVAASDSQSFDLNREEVLTRIQQFYRV